MGDHRDRPVRADLHVVHRDRVDLHRIGEHGRRRRADVPNEQRIPESESANTPGARIGIVAVHPEVRREVVHLDAPADEAETADQRARADRDLQRIGYSVRAGDDHR